MLANGTKSCFPMLFDDTSWMSPEESSRNLPSLLPTRNTDPEAQLPKKAKASHSVIERRYRENLNTKITQLDQALSLIRQSHKQAEDLEADEKSIELPGKFRKADVLKEATRHIKQVELESKARIKEIEFLRLRVIALEKLVNCGDCTLLKQFSSHQIGISPDF